MYLLNWQSTHFDLQGIKLLKLTLYSLILSRALISPVRFSNAPVPIRPKFLALSACSPKSVYRFFLASTLAQ